MAKDPAALLYIDKWITATQGMTGSAKGWFLDLILYQYDKGSLPNDEDELASICRIRPSEATQFEQVFKQVLKQKFEQNSEQRLENSFAKEILRKRELFKDKRSGAGKISYLRKVFISQHPQNDKALAFFLSEITKHDLSDIDVKNQTSVQNLFKQVFKQKSELLLNVIVNEDVIINSKGKEGPGEKPLETVFDVFEAEVLKLTSEKEAFCMQNKITVEKYNELAKAFITEQRIIGNAGWKGTKETKSHMINWMRRRFQDNNTSVAKNGKLNTGGAKVRTIDLTNPLK